jgi:hypothetical protein
VESSNNLISEARVSAGGKEQAQPPLIPWGVDDTQRQSWCYPIISSSKYWRVLRRPLMGILVSSSVVIALSTGRSRFFGVENTEYTAATAIFCWIWKHIGNFDSLSLANTLPFHFQSLYEFKFFSGRHFLRSYWWAARVLTSTYSMLDMATPGNSSVPRFISQIDIWRIESLPISSLIA